MRHLFRATLVLWLLATAAGAAFAHAHLKSAEPADKTTVAAPKLLRLTFSEPIELGFSSVQITAADKTAVAAGAVTHGSGGDAVLEVPLTGSLAAGEYVVEWKVLSKDGHKMKGSYAFTVQP